jgi:hypothetical protein
MFRGACSIVFQKDEHSPARPRPARVSTSENRQTHRKLGTQSYEAKALKERAMLVELPKRRLDAIVHGP